jgi:uncharacterized phage protein (TIGR02220 family)
MRDFAKVSPQIWTSELGRQIKNLGVDARVISLYLQTSPSAHMTGVYYIPVVLIAHEAGLTVEKTTVVLNDLCQIGYCTYDYKYEYVWVHEMGVEQVCAQLKPNDNRIKAINAHYSSLPKLAFLQGFYDKYAELFLLDRCHDSISPLQAPSNTLRSNEKENESEKENDNENKNEKKTILSGAPDIGYEGLLFSSEKKSQVDEEKRPASYLSQASDVLNFLNEKTKSRFRDEVNQKLIIARLKSGASVDDCRAVIARKFRDWNNTDMKKYLRPATLFNAIKFEQYLGECVVVDEAKDKTNQEGLKNGIE